MQKKRIIRALLIPLVLLLIPLAIQLLAGSGVDGVGWNWKPWDFVFAYAVWMLAGLSYVLLTKNADHKRKVRIAIIAFLALAFVWVGAATGFEGVIDRIQQFNAR